MNKIHSLQRFFRLLNLDRETIVNIYIYAIFNGLITLSLPLGIQAIINLISGGQLSTSWYILVIMVLAGIIISGIMQVLQLALAEDLQQKIFAHSAFEFTYRIPRFKRDIIERYNIPDLVNRFFDVMTLQKGISKMLLDFSRALLQVVLGILLLSLYHPFFILYGVVLLVVLVVVFRFTAPLGLKSSIKESNYKYSLVHWMEELARAFDAFNMSGDTIFPLTNTNRLVKGYLKHRQEHFKILVMQYFVMIGFKVLITGGLLILGGVLVINQQMNIGQFVAAEIVIILLMNSVEKLVLSFETIYDVLTGLEKIGYVVDLPLEEQGGMQIEQEDKGIRVHFKGLSYNNVTDKIQVTNLTSEIQSGEKIAVTGFSKSGKSLFLQLAAGFYRDFTGVISYNDIPLGNIDMIHLRGYIGENLGKEYLFEGTILENIIMGREGITQNDVEEMAKVFNLHKDIENLGQGYNEVVLSGGKYLQEGVAIKLLLVRALVHKPKLILLNDTFDVLDNSTIDQLFEYLMSDETKATVVIATRRRKYLKLLNNIIWMEDGQVKNRGSYKDLLAEDDFTIMVK